MSLFKTSTNSGSNTMIIRNALLACVLLLTGWFLFEGSATSRGYERFPLAQVDVQRYRAHLEVFPDSLYVQGWIAIDVQTDSMWQGALPLFMKEGLILDSLWVDSTRVVATLKEDTLWVQLPSSDTLHVVHVWYHGKPSTGLYRKTYRNQEVLFTDSWPERARGWLPSLDHPSDPASFELFLTLPENYEPIASGKLLELERRDGKVTAHYVLSGTAPTYAMAFAAADFSHYSFMLGDTLPIHFYMLPSDSHRVDLLNRTPETLVVFSYLIGSYPYRQYSVAQIPIEYGGMENASIPFLKASMFATTAPGPGNSVESVQVHEAAHQWFGDAVTIANWNHLWLSEGMATYLTTVFYEHIDGEDAARWRRAEMAIFGRQEARTHGPLVPRRPVDPDSFLTWVPYRKGGSVLHLLRLKLGDDAFFGALREAYRRYRGRSWSTEDFQHVLEHYADTSLQQLFDYWVYGDSLPTLHLQWKAAERQLRWYVDGDAHTLDDVPFELLVVSEDERTVLLTRADTVHVFEGWPDTPPTVLPVGIMMKKQWD